MSRDGLQEHHFSFCSEVAGLAMTLILRPATGSWRQADRGAGVI